MVKPTGVGKHQCGMLKALAERKNVDLELIVPVRDVSPRAGAAISALGDITMRRIPWTARNLERMWKILNWPDIGYVCKGADWVYSPFEAMPRVKKIPRIATVHQMMWFDKTSPWYGKWARIRLSQKRLYDRMADEAEVIMCVSEYLRERFADAYPHAADRTHVVFNGAEDVYFEAGSVAREGEYNKIITIGSLTEVKGAKLLFEVADTLSSKMPAKKILAIGGLCSPPEMLKEASRYTNLVLYNYLEAEQIVELMKDAFMLLQVSPTETFGIPVVEAMAAGLPVVAVDAMATKEVLGDAGILVSNGDSAGICKAIVSLSKEESMVKRLRHKGFERAELFRWSKCADRLLMAMQAC